MEDPLNLKIKFKCNQKSCFSLENLIIENYKEGYTCCGHCGFIIENQIISTEKEWRDFEGDPTVRDRIGSKDDVYNIDNTFTTINDMKLQRVNIMTQKNQRVTNKTLNCYKLIRVISGLYGLPELIQKDVLEICKDVYAKNISKRDKIIVGISFMISFRKQNLFRSWREIEKMTSVKAKILSKYFNQYKMTLEKTDDIIISFNKISQYLHRRLMSFGVNFQNSNQICQVYEKYKNVDIFDNQNPDFIMSILIYLVQNNIILDNSLLPLESDLSKFLTKNSIEISLSRLKEASIKFINYQRTIKE